MRTPKATQPLPASMQTTNKFARTFLDSHTLMTYMVQFTASNNFEISNKWRKTTPVRDSANKLKKQVDGLFHSAYQAAY